MHFNDFCQASYFKIYRTDFRQLSRFGRTLAVNDQSEISVSMAQGTLPWQPIFVGLSTELNTFTLTRWCQPAALFRLMIYLLDVGSKWRSRAG